MKYFLMHPPMRLMHPFVLLGIRTHSVGDSHLRQWGLAVAAVGMNGGCDPIEVKNEK